MPRCPDSGPRAGSRSLRGSLGKGGFTSHARNRRCSGIGRGDCGAPQLMECGNASYRFDCFCLPCNANRSSLRSCDAARLHRPRIAARTEAGKAVTGVTALHSKNAALPRGVRSVKWSGQEDLYYLTLRRFSKLLILNDAKNSRTAEIPPSKYISSTRGVSPSPTSPSRP